MNVDSGPESLSGTMFYSKTIAAKLVEILQGKARACVNGTLSGGIRGLGRAYLLMLALMASVGSIPVLVMAVATYFSALTTESLAEGLRAVAMIGFVFPTAVFTVGIIALIGVHSFSSRSWRATSDSTDNRVPGSDQRDSPTE